ncbi:MAG: hypothetical protein R3D69_16545 [Xanthobacteraceae bacterium]
MSFQIGVLKVLSSHPDGRACVDAIKRDLALLASREWNAQLRRLAALAPRIDVFSAGLILRTPDAWQITEAGRDVLTRLERGEAIEATPRPEPAPWLKPETKPEPGPEPAWLSAAPPPRPQRPLLHYRPTIEIRRPEPRRRPFRPTASAG